MRRGVFVSLDFEYGFPQWEIRFLRASKAPYCDPARFAVHSRIDRSLEVVKRLIVLVKNVVVRYKFGSSVTIVTLASEETDENLLKPVEPDVEPAKFFVVLEVRAGEKMHLIRTVLNTNCLTKLEDTLKVEIMLEVFHGYLSNANDVPKDIFHWEVGDGLGK